MFAKKEANDKVKLRLDELFGFVIGGLYSIRSKSCSYDAQSSCCHLQSEVCGPCGSFNFTGYFCTFSFQLVAIRQ